MTTRLTAPLWRLVPGLSFLFFPYRWLVVASAGACLLAALSGSMLMRGARWGLLQMGALSAIVLLNLALDAVMVARAPADSGAISLTGPAAVGQFPSLSERWLSCNLLVFVLNELATLENAGHSV